MQQAMGSSVLFSTVFCSFDKKIWKRFGFFFSKCKLPTNFSIFLKKFAKFLISQNWKKNPLLGRAHIFLGFGFFRELEFIPFSLLLVATIQ
jgi:hypothetical protein